VRKAALVQSRLADLRGKCAALVPCRWLLRRCTPSLASVSTCRCCKDCCSVHACMHANQQLTKKALVRCLVDNTCAAHLLYQSRKCLWPTAAVAQFTRQLSTCLARIQQVHTRITVRLHAYNSAVQFAVPQAQLACLLLLMSPYPSQQGHRWTQHARPLAGSHACGAPAPAQVSHQDAARCEQLKQQQGAVATGHQA
jgi:hypothetical protein